MSKSTETKKNENVLDKILPDGQYVIRKSLAEYFGGDSSARNIIAMYRKSGVIIVNNQDGKGYRRLKMTKKNAQDIAKWVKQEEARARNIYKALVPAKKFLRDIDAFFKGGVPR